MGRRAAAATRLTTAVATTWRAAGESPMLSATEQGGCLLAVRGCLLILHFLFGPFAPFALLAGAGWGLQQYQSRYYGDALSQVHAQQPVFADRLVYDDGRRAGR